MAAEITEDAVLGGRLRLRQPKRGHRVGHDAMLLAAATPGRAGEHAIDLGAGVGGAGLALAHRVEGLRLTLIEIDPTLAVLARENVELNGLAERVAVTTGDVADLNLEDADRILMNPPFNNPARAQSSPDLAKRRAHMAADDTLEVWTGAAARLLRPGGTLTMIWRADGLVDVETALRAAFGHVLILPVFPRDGAEAIRVLVRAERGAVQAREVLPGLVLADPAGRPTSAAEAILREGKTLPLATI